MLAALEQDLPRTGDIIAGKYQIEGMLGRGGMGAVYQVKHRVTGKNFAVKWLLPQLTAGDDTAQRFIREAQVAGRVNHPNVVEVYDVGDDGGSLYMVMELLQGEALSQRIAAVGRLTAAAACQIMIPVTRGLAAAHHSGIVHRDLKPDNIFLSVSSHGGELPKVLDFGISKMSPLAAEQQVAITRAGVVMGTPHYMAPEQVRSQPVDARTDVYALGVIMYQMLSGKLPFSGENFPELVLKIISDTPEPLRAFAPEAPAALLAIVERAMSRDIAQRFASVTELGRALEPFADGMCFDVTQAITTRPPPPEQRGPRTPLATESKQLLSLVRRRWPPFQPDRSHAAAAAGLVTAALLSSLFLTRASEPRSASAPAPVRARRDPQPSAAAIVAPQLAAPATVGEHSPEVNTRPLAVEPAPAPVTTSVSAATAPVATNPSEPAASPTATPAKAPEAASAPRPAPLTPPGPPASTQPKPKSKRMIQAPQIRMRDFWAD